MKTFYYFCCMMCGFLLNGQNEAEHLSSLRLNEVTLVEQFLDDSCCVQPKLYFNQSTTYCTQEDLQDFCFSLPSRPDYINTNWPVCGLGLSDPSCLTFMAGPGRLTSLRLNVEDCQAEGIQYGIYEVPDDILLDSAAAPLPYGELTEMVSSCVFVEDPQRGERLLRVPTKEGRVYVIVFDPYNQSFCRVSGSLLNGLVLPSLDTLHSHRPYIQDQQSLLEVDTVCYGMETVMRSGYELRQARYIWSVNGQTDPAGGQSVEYRTVFPSPGSFEVCVQMVFCGDTSKLACQTIVVKEKEDFVVEDTICLGQPFRSWKGPFGITFMPDTGMIDVWQIGRSEYRSIYINGFGCSQDVILDLFVLDQPYKECLLEGSQKSSTFHPISPLTVFPNPVRERLTVGFEDRLSGQYTIDLLHWSGQLALTQSEVLSSKSAGISLAVGHLAAGSYVLVVKDEFGHIVGRQKVVLSGWD